MRNLEHPIPFGKYLLLEIINTGGMAEVFKAKAFGIAGFERILAIKRIWPHWASDEKFTKMFIDEARIAVQLTNPNIVQVYELGMVDGQHYIAMEYVQGRDLRQIFDRMNEKNRAMPIPHAAHIASSVCAALDYAHRKNDVDGTSLNIVHRDISPHNVLVGYDGTVKVADFGIAKAEHRLSQTQGQSIKGKLGYMSPEQAMGQDMDRRSDIYAVGVLLHELITGQRLFDKQSDFSAFEQMKTADIPRPSEVNSNLPDEMDRIISKALAYDAVSRYQWANEVAEELQQFLIEDRSIFGSQKMATFMREEYADSIQAEQQRMEELLRLVPAPGQIRLGETTLDAAENLLDAPTVIRERAKKTERSRTVSGTVIIARSTETIAALNDSDAAPPPAGPRDTQEVEDDSKPPRDTQEVPDDSPSRSVRRVGRHDTQEVFPDPSAGRVANASTGTLSSNGRPDTTTVVGSDGQSASPYPTEVVPQLVVNGGLNPNETQPHAHFDANTEIADRLEAYKETTDPLALGLTQPSQAFYEKTELAGPRTPAGRQRRRGIGFRALPATAFVLVLATAILALKLGVQKTNVDAEPQESAAAAPPAGTRPDSTGLTANSPPPSDNARPTASHTPFTGTAEEASTPGVPTKAPARHRPKTADEPPNDASAGTADAGAAGNKSGGAKPDRLSTSAKARAEYTKVRRSVELEMRKHAIIDGDIPAFDAQRQKMLTLARRSKYVDAKLAAERALALLGRTEINERFVLTKLKRFNREFDKSSAGQSNPRLKALAQEITASVTRGDFKNANKQLNQALRILGGTR